MCHATMRRFQIIRAVIICSHELVRVIQKAKDDLRVFMNAPSGQFFVGESGTELIFRLVMNACSAQKMAEWYLALPLNIGNRSACARWSKVSRKTHVLIAHDDDLGLVKAEDYTAHVTQATKVATILHTSPLPEWEWMLRQFRSYRAVSPDCYIIVDGIQHAAHGQIDIAPMMWMVT